MIKAIIASFVLFLRTIAFAQPCTLDLHFANGGKTAFPIAIANEGINTLGIQANNGIRKIIVAGTVLLPGNPPEYQLGLARIDTIGSLDPSFGVGGTLVYDFTPNSDDWAEDLVVLPDNSFLVCGTSGDKSLVAMFDMNGIPINTFGNNGIVVGGPDDMEIARALVLQADGKIVVAGTKMDFVNQRDNFAVARYNADGSLDNTFGNNGRVITIAGTGYDSATDLLIQPDGKIVAGGYRENGQGSSGYDFTLVRYLDNGSLDPSFGVNGIVDMDVSPNASIIRSILLMPNGKIVAAGTDNITGINDCIIARYYPDGTLDSTFNATGVQIIDKGAGGNDDIQAIVLQPDGKIVATGGADQELFLTRFDTNGNEEPPFVSCVIDFDGGSDAGECLTMYGNKIIVGGIATINGQQDFALAQYQNDINVDIPTLDNNSTITLFPNPTSGLVEIHFDHFVNGFLEVVSMDGRMVISQTLENANHANLNLLGQRDGFYFIRVVENQNASFLKLLISK